MRILMVLLLLVLSKVATAEGYPTTEIVKFVVGCMADNGGQTEENLYTCACRLDSISAKFTFDEYDSAVLFERYANMPGKRGGLFRDSEQGEKLKARLKSAREEAAKQCPVVVRLEREPPADR